MSARADVHQTGRTASPVAETVAYVHHVRILFRRFGGLGRVFDIEKVLGGGCLLETWPVRGDSVASCCFPTFSRLARNDIPPIPCGNSSARTRTSTVCTDRR